MLENAEQIGSKARHGSGQEFETITSGVPEESVWPGWYRIVPKSLSGRAPHWLEWDASVGTRASCCASKTSTKKKRWWWIIIVTVEKVYINLITPHYDFEEEGDDDGRSSRQLSRSASSRGRFLLGDMNPIEEWIRLLIQNQIFLENENHLTITVKLERWIQHTKTENDGTVYWLLPFTWLQRKKNSLVVINIWSWLEVLVPDDEVTDTVQPLEETTKMGNFITIWNSSIDELSKQWQVVTRTASVIGAAHEDGFILPHFCDDPTDRQCFYILGMTWGVMAETHPGCANLPSGRASRPGWNGLARQPRQLCPPRQMDKITTARILPQGSKCTDMNNDATTNGNRERDIDPVSLNKRGKRKRWKSNFWLYLVTLLMKIRSPNGRLWNPSRAMCRKSRQGRHGSR